MTVRARISIEFGKRKCLYHFFIHHFADKQFHRKKQPHQNVRNAAVIHRPDFIIQILRAEIVQCRIRRNTAVYYKEAAPHNSNFPAIGAYLRFVRRTGNRLVRHHRKTEAQVRLKKQRRTEHTEQNDAYDNGVQL